MRKCFWAAAELLSLFAIRSDRQHSHIHHCHLPLDSLFSPHPSFLSILLSSSSLCFSFFPSSSEIAHFVRVRYLNYLPCYTEDIPLCFINSLSLSLSPAPPLFSSSSASLHFHFLIYLCVFHPHLGCPNSVAG